MSNKTTKTNKKLSRKYLSIVAVVTSLIGGSFFFHEYMTDVQAKEKTELIESAAIEKEIEQFEKALSQKAYNELKETRVKTAIVERKERLAEEAKKEAERLAKEKKEKEEAAAVAEAKRLEEERVAEAKRLETGRHAAEQEVLEETSSYDVYEEVEVETAPTQDVSAPAVTEVVEEEPVSAPQPVVQQTTSGFNFNGRHFDLSWFSGSGQVPADNYVYRWSDDPSHYLIERMGTAGAYIKEIGVGSQVIIDGQSYTIFRVDSGIANDVNAYYNMKGVGATITFQTCDHTVGANGRFDLTIWYAHPS